MRKKYDQNCPAHGPYNLDVGACDGCAAEEQARLDADARRCTVASTLTINDTPPPRCRLEAGHLGPHVMTGELR